MNLRSIETRLKKLEGRRRQTGMIYFVWGRTDEEIENLLTDAVADGDLGPTDPNACVLWNGRGIPASGWRAYKDLTDQEQDALDANLRRVAAGSTEPSASTSVVALMSNEQLLTIALGRAVPADLREASEHHSGDFSGTKR